MSALFTSVALLLATTQGPAPTIGEHLLRGVQRAHNLEGWRRPLQAEAMQEAWCLLLEHHPDVVQLTDSELQSARIVVERKSGRTVDLPVETRLFEIGVIARNTILRDNHLNRQTSYQPVRFTAVDEGYGYQLDVLGTRTAAARPEQS